MHSIFVQIASYRDPECHPTVADLFSKARHPERVFVGICNQVDLQLDHECFGRSYPLADQVRERLVAASDSRGVCWARHQAEQLYAGEDYLLVIDSHMRFVENWDELCIRELDLCASEKAVLSHYPPPYSPPDRLTVMHNAIVMTVRPFDLSGDLRCASRVLTGPSERPLRGALVAGCFLFAKAQLLREVPYDPHLYFSQEEIAMSVRLYTHGWDVFSPRTHIAYHLYTTARRGGKRRLHWDDHDDWSRMSAAGRKRLQHLLSGRTGAERAGHLVDIDRYGLGAARTLQQFEAFVGIDFAAKRTAPKAREGTFIDGILRYV